MKAYKTKYHRDGTLTVWDVYKQGWQRLDAGSVPARILATLTDKERAMISIIEIAKDAQQNHGCPNPGSIVRHVTNYTYFDDAQEHLTRAEILDAIDKGWFAANLEMDAEMDAEMEAI